MSHVPREQLVASGAKKLLIALARYTRAHIDTDTDTDTDIDIDTDIDSDTETETHTPAVAACYWWREAAPRSRALIATETESMRHDSVIRVT